MQSFLQNLENETDIQLKNLEVGFGTQGMSFSATVDYHPPSLSKLLSSLGLDLPGNGTGLDIKDVLLSLTYERSRGNTTDKSYATIVKILMEGPLRLETIFEAVHFPIKHFPEIDKIELSFELDKSTGLEGNASNRKRSTKTTEIGFKMQIDSPPASNGHPTTSGPLVMAGLHHTITENNATQQSIAAVLYAENHQAFPIGFGDFFPFDVALKDLYYVKTSRKNSTISKLNKKNNLTIVSAQLNIDINNNWDSIPILGEFLKEASFEIQDLNAFYCNEAVDADHLLFANELLDTINAPPIVPIRIKAGDSKDSKQTKTLAKGVSVHGQGFMKNDFDMSEWISSWPGNLPTETLEKVAGIFPPFKITDVTFNYFQDTKAINMGATAILEVSQQVSTTPLAFKLAASRRKTTTKKLTWNIKGESQFTSPLTLAHMMDGIMHTFGITESIPEDINALNLSINKLTFQYDTANETFDFLFTLDKPAHFSALTGSDQKESAASPHSFSVFHLTRTKSGNEIKTTLLIKIEAGLSLSQMLNTGDALPDSVNFTLDEIKFILTLDSTRGDSSSNKPITNKKEISSIASSSKSIEFISSFTDDNHQFKLEGVFEKSTAGSTNGKSMTIYGANISSPDEHGLNLGDNFPIGVSIKDLYIAGIKIVEKNKPTQSFTVFGSDLSAHGDIDLSSIPVIGPFLSEAKFKFQDLHFVYAKSSDTTDPEGKANTGTSKPKDIPARYTKQINNILHKIEAKPLVVNNSPVSSNTNTSGFPLGFSLKGLLILGNNAKEIPLHTNLTQTLLTKQTKSGNDKTVHDSSTEPTTTTTPTSVAKKFGPVRINTVNLGLSNGKIALKLTGGLILGPLELDFMGFEITSPVSTFDPSISLQGLNLDFTKPPLTIEGAFMEETIKFKQNGTSQDITVYNGSIDIGYEPYALGAFGSFSQLTDGKVSAFLYGFLDAVIGGPPFFIITGVAAGFGYNRGLTIPTAETVNTFPLIQPVLPSTGTPMNFDKMNKVFPPVEGDFWGAVGIRGDSFKMVESFIMLDVQFGRELEINIIGLSKMKFPEPPEENTSTPALAKINIGIVARILPEQGVVSIQGAFLPGSYVYNPMVHISGGFAVLTIFKDQTSGQWRGANAGDFVMTLGGYAPAYKPKSYYPRVPRLELNWQLSSALSIKALAYFAITPEAMMAGGHLMANFEEGGSFAIHVNFQVGANFIIYWKPYHYAAHFYAELAVSASINIDLWLFSIHAHISLDLGAELNIWGPDFSGNAAVHIHVLVSFCVHVSFGNASSALPPISWNEFHKTLLPKNDNILAANIIKGLESNQSSESYKIVNPKELELVCESTIPLKSITLNGSTQTFPNYLLLNETTTLEKPSIENGKWKNCSPDIISFDETKLIVTSLKLGKAFLEYHTEEGIQEVEIIVADYFGIKPMAKSTNNIHQSGLNIIVKIQGTEKGKTEFVPLTNEEVNNGLEIELITKNMPAALWLPATQEGKVPEKHGKTLMQNLQTGIKINAKRTSPMGTPYDLDTKKAAFDSLEMEPGKSLESFDYDTDKFMMNS